MKINKPSDDLMNQNMSDIDKDIQEFEQLLHQYNAALSVADQARDHVDEWLYDHDIEASDFYVLHDEKACPAYFSGSLYDTHSLDSDIAKDIVKPDLEKYYEFQDKEEYE